MIIWSERNLNRTLKVFDTQSDLFRYLYPFIVRYIQGVFQAQEVNLLQGTTLSRAIDICSRSPYVCWRLQRAMGKYYYLQATNTNGININTITSYRTSKGVVKDFIQYLEDNPDLDIVLH